MLLAPLTVDAPKPAAVTVEWINEGAAAERAQKERWARKRN